MNTGKWTIKEIEEINNKHKIIEVWIENNWTCIFFDNGVRFKIRNF